MSSSTASTAPAAGANTAAPRRYAATPSRTIQATASSSIAVSAPSAPSGESTTPTRFIRGCGVGEKGSSNDGDSPDARRSPQISAKVES